MDELLLVGGRVANGLLAGVYLAFAVVVMPTLRTLPDAVFLRVMTTVNRVIVGPVFMLVFFAAPALALVVAVTRRDAVSLAAGGAALLALVLTVAVHIPLNTALDAGGRRQDFEDPWTRWHLLRTGAATVACVLLCLPGR